MCLVRKYSSGDPQLGQQARRTIFVRICKEEGINQWLVDINLTFGFLRMELEALILPEALTLPSTIREEISAFLMGINLPSADKALKDYVPKGTCWCVCGARLTGREASRVHCAHSRFEDCLAQYLDSALLAQGTATLAPVLLGEQSGFASQVGEVRKPTCSQAVPMGNYCEYLCDAEVFWMCHRGLIKKVLGQVTLEMGQ